MFVFRRRHIQAMIDRLYAVMTREQVDKLVDRLNRADIHRLPTMWEVAFLDAFARQAEFIHEKPLSSGRRPDLGELRWREGELDLHLVGDITCISDRGLHEENPFQWLLEQIQGRAKKRGLLPRRFRLSVAGDYVPKVQKPRNQNRIFFTKPDAKATLALGPKRQLASILDREFDPFIEVIGAAPEQAHDLSIKEGEACFSISYRPGQNFSGGGHLSYTVAASLQRNPLANAMRNKADQLKAAPPDALRLLIVCDGGSALLQSSMQRAGSHSTYSATEIATEFLEKSNTIDFVMLISVENNTFAMNTRRKRQLACALVVAKETSRNSRVTARKIDGVRRLLESVVQSLPKELALDPLNAARQSLMEGCGRDDVGAWKWITQGSEMKIKLSARGLQRLLSGEITQERFAKVHGWDDPKGTINPFRMASERGQMITEARLEYHADRDDDMIELTLVEGDPANGRFLKRIPDAD